MWWSLPEYGIAYSLLVISFGWLCDCLSLQLLVVCGDALISEVHTTKDDQSSFFAPAPEFLACRGCLQLVTLVVQSVRLSPRTSLAALLLCRLLSLLLSPMLMGHTPKLVDPAVCRLWRKWSHFRWIKSNLEFARPIVVDFCT